MNKKLMAYLASGILLLGAAAGLGTYQARTAQAATTAVQATAPAAAATQIDTRQQQQQRDLQNPSYTASIRTANPQNAGEKKGQDNEAAESSSLQSLAKITPAQARASALQAVPGKVIKVSLDNENGNVVYSVEVQTSPL
ncbi:putative membrane protein YkoI [Desulfofundulus luciae]|uniref:Membrane protein YkoI n=1 Tax=Desulfofundulus luciae TaxID=74702 RepID=A0ABU0B2X7_9FIRM|nr:PepSY domain-containing protein [Desulfofundulus luciae]MDQ0287066.1 putative membrane protein YkoI [Desulfofundulus luciae]